MMPTMLSLRVRRLLLSFLKWCAVIPSWLSLGKKGGANEIVKSKVKSREYFQIIL